MSADDLPATLDQLTADQTERLTAVMDALDSGAVIFVWDDEGTPSLASASTTEPLLLHAYVSKAELLAAAREIAALHGLTKPRSASAAAADPVLAALLLSASNQAQGANQP